MTKVFCSQRSTKTRSVTDEIWMFHLLVECETLEAFLDKKLAIYTYQQSEILKSFDCQKFKLFLSVSKLMKKRMKWKMKTIWTRLTKLEKQLKLKSLKLRRQTKETRMKRKLRITKRQKNKFVENSRSNDLLHNFFQECWRLYEKMKKTGLNVSYDTILRGILKPSELRLLEKQKKLLSNIEEKPVEVNETQPEPQKVN